MSRISRSQLFMEIAHVVAKRSTCMRLNVGAVIVKDRSIIAIGYNGVPANAEHCRGNDCPGKQHCHETIHAEINALKQVPSGVTGPWDLYVTDSPCADCYDTLYADGRIKRIFFSTPYRITDHLINSLWNIGIYRLTPAGYIMNWETRELVSVET